MISGSGNPPQVVCAEYFESILCKVLQLINPDEQGVSRLPITVCYKHGASTLQSQLVLKE